VITLVLGGARSGKSRVAERIAEQLAQPVTYLATAEVTDEDFAERVARHRQRRDPNWMTVEAGTELASAVRRATGTILIDSLGGWVVVHDDFAVDIAALCTALTERDGASVIVSEEVGLGVHPSSSAGQRFRDVLGTVNCAVAEVSDEVLFVVAGRVLRLGEA
jgi:adenosyl cobinamide kinase/adenosyl cobinamide phosphate guanylyltransferase